MQISIIGTSKITYSHIQVLQKKFKIVSISSTRANSKNLKKIASKFKIKTTFTNWRKSIKHYKNKENLVFFITGRIKDNKKILRECCKYKNKIFIEKPVFFKSSDFNNFIKYKENIFVGYNRIFYKNIIFLKKQIKNRTKLNIYINCPEDNTKNIISNSCHIMSILFYLFGDLKLKKIFKSRNFINCFLTNRNRNFIFISFNFKGSSNFSIEINDKKKRYVLSPIEELKIYQGVKVFYRKKNKIYIPKLIKSLSEFKYDNFKPGFMSQAVEFKKFLKGKKILNDILFGKKIVTILEKILS